MREYIHVYIHTHIYTHTYIYTEMEEVRRMFAETDSRLLVVTLVVSAVHLIFDILAFGHDISFWNGYVCMYLCMHVYAYAYLVMFACS